MVSVSAVVIDLSTTERAVLTARARAAGGGHRDVLRARIVLAAAADGQPDAVIAAGWGCMWASLSVTTSTYLRRRDVPAAGPAATISGPGRRTRPTATLMHLPVHASWLNQAEIYFAVLQGKAIAPVDFADLDALATEVRGPLQHHRPPVRPAVHAR